MILLAETPVKYRDGTVKTLDELGGEVSELLPDTPVKSGTGTSKPLDEFIQDQIVLTPETSVVDGEDTTTLEDFVEDSIVLAPDTPVVDGSDTTTLEGFVEAHGGEGTYTLISAMLLSSSTAHVSEDDTNWNGNKKLKLRIRCERMDGSDITYYEKIFPESVISYIKALGDGDTFYFPKVSIPGIGDFWEQVVYDENDGYIVNYYADNFTITGLMVEVGFFKEL